MNGCGVAAAGLSRSISDAGRTLIEVDPRHTSDRCESCGLDWPFTPKRREKKPAASSRWRSHTIQQVSGGRFLDAHEIASLDFRVVTRPKQNNNTQQWRLFDFGGGFFTIQQVSSGRFLEATLARDFQVVTRPAPGNNQQTWRVGDR